MTSATALPPPSGESRTRLATPKGKQQASRIASLFQIPERTTPDQWARENRTYPISAAISGKREPSLTPYVIPVERAAASRRFKRVLMMSGSQVGKTDLILDLMGHKADQRPQPMMYAGPSKQLLTERFEPRVMELLDQSPALMSKVARGKKMTKTRKFVAGIPIYLTHGGSSAAFKSVPAALTFLDEYDELFGDIGDAGGPVSLIEARGYTYGPDFCVVITSTPSMGVVEVVHDETSGLDFWKASTDDQQIQSPVWRLWQEGTQYHWAWPCPHCERWFIPRFRNLK
jgi:phage terminase large subunit GpA-like protein